jgi:Ca2+-binding RTX toxin-like protein
VHYCYEQGNARPVRASAAGTSEVGWPAKQCLKMDKGNAGQHHTIIGVTVLHNWLLGGYGNDTIIGGNTGDVIWADYQPEGEPRWQSATIHAGNGRNVIYANDTVNYVWTGTNPRTVVHAHASGISGVIHCGSRQQVMFLSNVSEKHFTLDGCGRISHYSVGY